MSNETLMWIGLGVVAVAFFVWKRADLGPARARQLVASGATLVDVRSPAEYASGHIDGARNIPVGEVGRRTLELGSKATTIIVYCASGARSAMAKRTLQHAGFETVYNLGSMRNW